MLTRRSFLVPGALGALGVLGACSRFGSADGNGELTTFVGDGVVQEIPVEDRSPLPSFSGETLGGGVFDTKNVEAEILLVNIWGSWCAPCRKEAPVLRAMWQKYRDQSVQFVGIDVKDNDASAIAFEKSFGIDYPSIRSGDSATATLALADALPQAAVPSTVITDREGRVAVRIIGAATKTTLDDLLGSLVAE